MNDIVKDDIKDKIIEKIMSGECPEKIKNDLGCGYKAILMVISNTDFASKSLNLLNNSIMSLSPIALNQVMRIANDKSILASTRLKANQFLIDKALELRQSGEGELSPATMSQDELVKTLDALSKERKKRVKELSTSVEDMF